MSKHYVGRGVRLFAGSVGVTCARGHVGQFDGLPDMGASPVSCWPPWLAAAPRGRAASASELRRALYCGRARVAVRSSQRPCRAGRWGPCPTGAACTRRAPCVRRTATTAHRGSVRTRLDLLRPGASTSGRPSWIRRRGATGHGRWTSSRQPQIPGTSPNSTRQRRRRTTSGPSLHPTISRTRRSKAITRSLTSRVCRFQCHYRKVCGTLQPEACQASACASPVSGSPPPHPVGGASARLQVAEGGNRWRRPPW